jgi:serine/threonine-protein kinase
VLLKATTRARQTPAKASAEALPENESAARLRCGGVSYFAHLSVCVVGIRPSGKLACRARPTFDLLYDQSVGAAQPLTVIRERYRLDALIGEGGMASVWRAWDLTLQRPVAVKLLFARDSHTEEVLVDRFLREARIAASVQHRNVIHIVDFGTTTDGQPFMVMELLEGETLAARLRRQKPLPVADVVQIGHLTLRGLGAVHAAGIIHRDLKPENVYLKNEGGVVYPKILDFGISRSIDPPHGPRSALTTREGVIVGTPEYMSPEQARGVKQIDYRTDLYSMGVVLYESLTGKLPFVSENVGDLIIKIVTGSTRPVHELVPSVPRAVSDVVARAMARLPGDRFLDAAEMQEALLAASKSALMTALPALSNLPPDVPNKTSFSLPSRNARSLRPLNTPRIPQTRMLAQPAPQPANAQTLPPSAASPSVLAHTPAFGIIEAAPRQAFDPGDEAEFDPGGDPLSGQTLSGPAYADPVHTAESAATMSLAPEESSGESPLSTRPTERTPSVRSRAWLPFWLHVWMSNRTKRVYLAAAASFAVLALIIWLVSAASTEPRVPTQPEAGSPVDQTLKVSLKLNGVPKGAQVTVNGTPASDVIELPRSDDEHDVAVEAVGKLPWHMTYVPQTDAVVEVTLLDASHPTVVEPQPPAARSKRPAAKPRPRSPVLRVPDF